jgi:hypothetical protein
MTTNLLIGPKHGQSSSPGDFHAEVTGEKLLLPADVVDALATLKVRNAIQFLTYVQSFPSAVAESLRWNVRDVLDAAHHLVAQLRGHIPEQILNPPAPEERRYGALHPDEVITK